MLVVVLLLLQRWLLGTSCPACSSEYEQRVQNLHFQITNSEHLYEQ